MKFAKSPHFRYNTEPMRPAFWLVMTVVAAVLILYSLTLAPGVVGGDAGEHQFVVPLLGIPHATGYPLYVLLGKLWTLLLPFGEMAWRVNLFSAVNGALAAGVTALVVYRLTAHEHPFAAWVSAWVAGITLAWGLTFWQWSIIAGVRSLNILLFALLTLQAIIWREYILSEQPAIATRMLHLLAFTVGLSLAHHRTTVFYLPGLIALIAWYDRPLMWQPRRFIPLVLLTLAPLSLYAFIYVRGINDPPYSHEAITDLQSFWFLVGASDSAGLFLSLDPAYLPDRLTFIWNDLLRQISLLGVILAVIGGLWLAWRHVALFVAQGSLVILLFLFTLDFEVVNLSEAPTWYLMPAYFIVTVWLGLGVRTLGAGLSHIKMLQVAGPLLLAGSVLLSLSYYLAWPNYQQMHQQAITPLDGWRQRLRGTQAQRFVESSLPHVAEDSIIWGDWEQYTPMRYYQLIHGIRPDVTVRLPLDRWPEKVAAAHAIDQPVYLSRKPTDLLGTPYLSMAGPLIRLQSEPNLTPPTDMTPLHATFEAELELLGYRATIVPQPNAGPILQLHLWWRVPQTVRWDYALSLRLYDATGTLIHQQDATHPVLSAYPTTLWTPGEVVGDFYELPVHASPLTVHLLPYRTEAANQWHNLTLPNATQPGLILGPFVEQ